MDLLNELEQMATNIDDDYDAEYAPPEDEIARWQHLFSYTYADAVEQITTHRADLTRSRVSDELWALVGSEKETEGYSRMAFEHEIRTRTHKKAPTHAPIPLPPSEAESNYLVLLSGPLTTAAQIQSLASLPSPPSILPGISEKTGAAHTFCRITAPTRHLLRQWLAQNHPVFHPTFVRVSQARKDLSPTSCYPTLGVDSTLPQHRLDSAEGLVEQDQYPVTYFFYGTLADPAFLARLLYLDVAESSRLLRPARVRGGLLRSWKGKYKALVDGGEGDVVQGWAFEVRGREWEEELRVYESGAYEVVRCGIEAEGEGDERRGLTFRFAAGGELD